MALRNLKEAIQFPWLKRAGIMRDPSQIDHAFDRTYQDTWENPTAGGPPIIGGGVGSDGKLTWGGGSSVQPIYQSAVYTFAANAGLADQPFFIANQAYLVKSITEVHATAGNDASAVTCVVKKLISGVTVANGTALQTSTFDLKATANTVQTATLSTNQSVLTLAAGDRLAVDYTGTLTTLAGVCITVMLQATSAAAPTLDVTFAINANATLADTQFFVANNRYVVSAVRYSHTAAGTNGGAVNVQLVKDTSTNAPGAGTDMLTNNSNAGFDCKGTANVTQTGTLVATAATLLLAAGDRLSVDFAGTLTTLAGVVMTVSLIPLAMRSEVTYFFPGASVNTDQAFFIADRDYQVRWASEIHAVAAGGASTVQVVRDTGTDAPGAGTDLCTGSGFDLNGTAQTTQTNALTTTIPNLYLRSGDRLSVDFANAVQSSSGVLVTVQIQAI